jgi:aminopeptidase-like protein
MLSHKLEAGLDYPDLGARMYALIADLYPICRSITGNGLRDSLRRLTREIPLEFHEIASGTRVLDWTVPNEWNIRDAYVKNASGDKVIDFQQSNLHVLNYSIPLHRRMPLAELKQHLYSLSDHPDWIPYRTSYYNENWGLSASQRVVDSLAEGEYEVFIDSTLEKGSLTYGEYLLAGQIQDEVLISCHCCHPSLCNDNLSGMALATLLAKHLRQFPLRYSYRFLFIPGTIGSITWLSLNEERVSKIKHGLVVACVGDPGKLNYKKSRRGDAEIDQAVAHVLKHSGREYAIREFSPYGYDERQYCSPGFNLPVGSLTRTPYGQYAEYHTSADNLDLVRPACLADSFSAYLAVINVLEQNRVYLNTSPKGEPQLGKRGLFSTMGGRRDAEANEMALLWILNLSDGEHTLLDIADRAEVEFETIYAAAHALAEAGLLQALT